jgi:hypothetical protein
LEPAAQFELPNLRQGRAARSRVVADIWNIISSNYVTVGTANWSKKPYVNVDPNVYNGTWTGTYSDNKKFSITISDVSGFRAKVKYQSDSTVKYQDVLIRDDAFRIGDSKFTVTKIGTAQVKTVVTDPATGATTLLTAYAKKG